MLINQAMEFASYMYQRSGKALIAKKVETAHVRTEELTSGLVAATVDKWKGRRRVLVWSTRRTSTHTAGEIGRGIHVAGFSSSNIQSDVLSCPSTAVVRIGESGRQFPRCSCITALPLPSTRLNLARPPLRMVCSSSCWDESTGALQSVLHHQLQLEPTTIGRSSPS